MSRCIVFLNPPADGGSTGRAWLWVEDFGQKMDVALENARIAGEHLDLSFELGNVKVHYVELVQEVVETLSDFKETGQGIVVEA